MLNLALSIIHTEIWTLVPTMVLKFKLIFTTYYTRILFQNKIIYDFFYQLFSKILMVHIHLLFLKKIHL